MACTTVITERRSSARIETPYRVRLRGVDGEGRAFIEETLVGNLSAGGLYLRLNRVVSEGSKVTLSVRLSTAVEGDVSFLRLAAKGTVLRVEPEPDGTFGIAIEFKRRRVL